MKEVSDRRQILNWLTAIGVWSSSIGWLLLFITPLWASCLLSLPETEEYKNGTLSVVLSASVGKHSLNERQTKMVDKITRMENRIKNLETETSRIQVGGLWASLSRTHILKPNICRDMLQDFLSKG